MQDENGSLLQAIRQIPLLSHEETLVLFQQMEQGSQHARSQLIERNLRLVSFLAKQYRSGTRLEFDDLVQSGTLGLMHAVRKFNPAIGVPFSTYASRWIRSSIRRTLGEDRYDVYVPPDIILEIEQLRKHHRRLVQVLENEPTEEQLADALQVSIEHLRLLRDAQRSAMSLDAPSIMDDELSLYDSIEDIRPTPEQVVVSHLTSKVMYRQIGVMLETLIKRERQVLELRFGFDGGGERTLAQIGEIIGKSHETVRQIEATAMRNLARLVQTRDELLEIEFTPMREELPQQKKRVCEDRDRGNESHL